MENRNVIMILMVVIAILAVFLGLMLSGQIIKEESTLSIADKTISAGDSVVVKLKDSQGNPIADEQIKVKLTDKNGNEIEDTITTNSKGKAKLKVEDNGNYEFACTFDGNGKYGSASISDKIKVEKATTSKVDSQSSSTQNTISVVPEFDKYVKKSEGEYTVEATKWMGGSVGGFEVSLSRNGQMMDRSSYQSRAYFNDGSGWKWSNWDDGEVAGSTLHKYPVSNGVEIREVEVMF